MYRLEQERVYNLFIAVIISLFFIILPNYFFTTFEILTVSMMQVQG